MLKDIETRHCNPRAARPSDNEGEDDEEHWVASHHLPLRAQLCNEQEISLPRGTME